MWCIDTWLSLWKNIILYKILYLDLHLSVIHDKINQRYRMEEMVGNRYLEAIQLGYENFISVVTPLKIEILRIPASGSKDKVWEDVLHFVREAMKNIWWKTVFVSICNGLCDILIYCIMCVWRWSTFIIGKAATEKTVDFSQIPFLDHHHVCQFKDIIVKTKCGGTVWLGSSSYWSIRDKTPCIVKILLY